MLRAVIADDEPAVESILRRFLEPDTVPLEIAAVARDGEEALRVLQAVRPDIVFLDIQMPKLNGFEVLSRHPGGNYIIITAHESFANAQQALRLGAKDILLKPIDRRQLMEAIARAVGWRCTASVLANKALEYIHRHYAGKVSLPDMAEAAHTSPSHLSRTFKKHVGQGVLAYLNRVRVAAAQTMLEDVSANVGIQSVAAQCGFENINNFYKHFKAVTGETPGAYRERLPGR